MLYQAYLVAPLILSLIASTSASNHTDDAALFSTSIETTTHKASHHEQTAAPLPAKVTLKDTEGHTKSPLLSSSKVKISPESISSKIETSKQELTKPLSASNTTTTVEKVKSTEHHSASIKQDVAKHSSLNSSSTKIDAPKLTTALPVSVSTASIDKIVKHVLPSSVNTTAKSNEHAHENETIRKFSDYLKPICESVDKILPKPLSKLQTQFKNFVQLTNGKLSLCFMEHFLFDPALNSITIPNLKTLCSSKSSSKGSFKTFANCAASHWSPAVDKELDHIIDARLNCVKNHQHSKNATASGPILDHDNEDEFSMVSDLVNKVLQGDKVGSAAKNADIKVLDFSAPTTIKPTANSSVSSSLKQILKQAITTSAPLNFMNDPNTVMVFVDDAKTTKKPLIPETSSLKSKIEVTSASSNVSHTTIKPLVIHSTAKFEIPSTNIKSTTEVKKLVSETPTSTNKTSVISKLVKSSITTAPPTSSKPTVIASGTTSSPKSSITEVKKVEVMVTSTKPPISNKTETTIKSVISTIAPASSTVAPTTTVPPTVATKAASKSSEALGDLIARQEKEKSDLEKKLKAEREKIMGQLQKKQGEAEAQKAIKALQYQQEVSANHHTDNRLHQLEHERQMTMDPIGHTIKHQQYELSKQRMTASRAV